MTLTKRYGHGIKHGLPSFLHLVTFPSFITSFSGIKHEVLRGVDFSVTKLCCIPYSFPRFIIIFISSFQCLRLVQVLLAMLSGCELGGLTTLNSWNLCPYDCLGSLQLCLSTVVGWVVESIVRKCCPQGLFSFIIIKFHSYLLWLY